MQARVKFTQYGHNTALGNFGPGDVAVCGASMARHLVEQVGCARYVQQPARSEPPAAQAAPHKTPRRTKRAVLQAQEPPHG